MSQLNMGNVDRAIRIVIGSTLIGLSAFGVIGPWGYAGVILVLTGMVALCPLYSLFGWRTTTR